MFTTTDKRRPATKVMITTAALIVGLYLGGAVAEDVGEPYGFGATPSEAELEAVTIAILPDGRHLPAGEGTAQTGKPVYETKCLACHGVDLKGVKETGGAALVGGRGTLASGAAVKTVESYWPYATTVFDYVRRAMPFDAPGSLSNDEVYALVAYLLAQGGIIEETDVMNADSLAEVKMPNRDGFIPDPRPDVRNYN